MPYITPEEAWNSVRCTTQNHYDWARQQQQSRANFQSGFEHARELADYIYRQQWINAPFNRNLTTKEKLRAKNPLKHY